MNFVRRLSFFYLAAGLAALSATASASTPAAGLAYPATDYFEQSPGRAGGVLRMTSDYEAGNLDIQFNNSGGLLWEGRFLFDNLVYLDHTGQPTPWLARSWTVSPDGRTYTFHLRSDVTFSDGTRFDAEAARANFARIKSLGAKSRVAGANLAPYAEGLVIDDFTFQAKLSAPFPDFLGYLAQTWLGFISPRQIREAPETIPTRPVGTGPFILGEHESGKRAVFKRRADYAWAPDYLRHPGPAYLDEIILEAAPDDHARIAALRDGRDHLTFDALTDQVAALKADPQIVYSNRLRPGSPQRGFTFNAKRFPFDDVRIRQAVARVIDREALIRSYGYGEFVAKSDFLVSNTPGYDPSFRSVLAYDPTAAAALFDAAGWTTRDADGYRTKGGRRLGAEVLTTGSERTPPIAVLGMQADLKKAGFELRLKFVKSAELSQLVTAGEYDTITGAWWSANTPDVLFIQYHSSQKARQNTFGQDTANLGDPTLDTLLQRARESIDATERRQLYREAQRLLTELVPVVPLSESQHIVAYRRELHGVLFDTTHNTPILTAAWLDCR